MKNEIVYLLIFFLGLNFVSAVDYSNVPEANLVWEYEDSQMSSDDLVSVGDFGSQVFFAKGNYGINVLGISRFDSGTLSPFIDGYFPGAAFFQHFSSSKDSNVHVYDYHKYEGGPYSGQVIFYDSTSGKKWEWQPPYIFLDGYMESFVTDDGSKVIVASYDYVHPPKNWVHVIDSNSGMPINNYNLGIFLPIRGGEISGNGEILATYSDGEAAFYNLNTNTEMFQEYIMGGLSCSGNPIYVNEDGSKIILGCGKTKGIRVFQRNGNSYNEVYNYYDNDFVHVSALKVSDDGSRAVAIILGSDGSVKIIELDLVNQNVIYENVLPTSSYNSALDITEDGNYYALEFNGQGGTVPEVQVFRFRTYSTEKTPVSKYYTNGEVYNMEFTPQGDALVINYKSGSGGKFAVLEPFPLGVRMEGIPKIGSMVTFVQPWFSGLINKVVYSNSLNPMEIPPWGWLYPNRNTLYILPSGTNVVDKTLTNYVIPNNPALVGTNLYFQGVGFNPRDLSDNYIGFTILPA